MTNYYDILGLPKTADQAQIRAAYKRLAMAYHPDHNPGNRDAEELFKAINEAYHTLSDPLKKSRYDARFTYTEVQELSPDPHEVNKWKYYQWKRAQQKTYTINREYFKIQGLAFLVFTVIAGFCFALLHTANYMVQQRELKRYQATTQALLRVDTLFTAGRFADAFNMIKTLAEKDPLEYRYNYARDSLLYALRHLADDRYRKNDYATAITHYLELKKHENAVRTETIRQIALCEYYLGNYKESLQALKHLHNQSPRNLQLVFEIGLLYLNKLDNPKEALHYFTLGKKLFKKNLSEVYGSAFEVVMDPADAPDIYFDIFQGRAMANLKLRNYSEAVTDCNWAVFLRPRQGLPYKLRAEANIGLHSGDKVCADLARARDLAGLNTEPLRRRYCR